VGEEEKLHDLLTFIYLIEVNYQIRELHNFYLIKCSFIFTVKKKQPRSGLGLLVVEVSRSHTLTHTHTQKDSSEQVTTPRRAATYTTNTRDEHPYRQQDSNPPSQQSSGLRPHVHQNPLRNILRVIKSRRMIGRL